MTTVFISYRRSDAPYAARHINDALVRQFGSDNVYFDLDALQAGLDWRKQIDEMVALCDVMLVVIGGNWLQADESGHSRLENEDDLVRLEVSSALDREIPVIPVLVGKATIPVKDSLPEEVKPLIDLQAVEVRATANFGTQIDRLVKSIIAVAPEEVTPETAEAEGVVPEDIAPLKRSIRKKPFAVFAAAVVSTLLVYLFVFVLPINKCLPSLMLGQPEISGSMVKINGVVLPLEGCPAIVRLFWTWGDGIETKSWFPAAHKYSHSGEYGVSVRALDAQGNSSTESVRLTIIETEPVLESEKPKFVAPEMVVIPAGSFVMGSPPTDQGRRENEGPVREVKIASFAIGKFEVTVKQFEQFVKSTSYRTDAEQNKGESDGCYVFREARERFEWDWTPGTSFRAPGWAQEEDHPAVCISWRDAKAYVNWLAVSLGEPYRLPSEAELEYVIRAGTTTTFPWGEAPFQGCTMANLKRRRAFNEEKLPPCNDTYVFTSPIGRFKENAFGLHDVSGNAAEWAEDCGHDSYADAPVDGSAWASYACNSRVFRGGGWASPVEGLRSASRAWKIGSYRDDALGFRVAQDLPD